MKIETDERGNIVIKEVYSGVIFVTDEGERLGICMRDSGFEFRYAGVWYRAVKGKLEKTDMPASREEKEIVYEVCPVEIKPNVGRQTWYEPVLTTTREDIAKENSKWQREKNETPNLTYMYRIKKNNSMTGRIIQVRKPVFYISEKDPYSVIYVDETENFEKKRLIQIETIQWKGGTITPMENQVLYVYDSNRLYLHNVVNANENNTRNMAFAFIKNTHSFYCGGAKCADMMVDYASMVRAQTFGHNFDHCNMAKEAKEKNVERVFPFPLDAQEFEVFAIKPDQDSRTGKSAYIGFKNAHGDFHFVTVPYSEEFIEKKNIKEAKRKTISEIIMGELVVGGNGTKIRSEIGREIRVQNNSITCAMLVLDVMGRNTHENVIRLAEFIHNGWVKPVDDTMIDHIIKKAEEITGSTV